MKKLIIAIVAILSVSFAGDITPQGMNQGDLYEALNNTQLAIMYRTLLSADVATGSASTTLSTTTAIDFANNGKLYALAAAGSISLNATVVVDLAEVAHTYSAAKPLVWYGLHVGADGSYRLNRSNGDYYPALVSGYTPLAVIGVTLDSDNTAGFTPGTTNWDAASQNTQIQDITAMSSGTNKVKLTSL